MTARVHSRKALRPKGKKKKPLSISSIAIYSLLILLSSIIVFFLIASLPMFKIEGVDVAGTRLLLSDEAVRTANIPLGNSILLTSFSDAKRRLLEIPIVKKVSFSRILPSHVLIKVEERKESVVCVLKNKQSLILDKDGVVLNPANQAMFGVEFPDITGLPVMNGLEESWLESGRYIKADVGRDVLKLLSEFEDFIVPQSLQIDISDTHDIKLLADDVLRVRIGSASDLKQKMKVFESIYQKVRGKKNDIEYVDVSSVKFPVVKFRN